MITFNEFIYDYYEKGYHITRVTPDLLKDFWREIYTTNWIDSKSVFKKVPDWYVEGKPIDIKSHDAHQEFEYHANKRIMQQCPDSLKHLAKCVSELPVFNYLKVYKQTPYVSYLHMWNGAEGGDFHQDVIDGSSTLVLIYFTEEQEWNDDWGARLFLKKNINDVEHYPACVKPLSGNMVIINNDNPLFMHKVEELKNKDVNRYTFAFSYNWKLSNDSRTNN